MQVAGAVQLASVAEPMFPFNGTAYRVVGGQVLLPADANWEEAKDVLEVVRAVV